MSNKFSFSPEDEADDLGGALEEGPSSTPRSRTPRIQATPVASPVKKQPAAKPVRSAPAPQSAGPKRTTPPSRTQPTRAPIPSKSLPAASAPSPATPSPAAPRRTGGLPTSTNTGSLPSSSNRGRGPAPVHQPAPTPSPQRRPPFIEDSGDMGYNEEVYQENDDWGTASSPHEEETPAYDNRADLAQEARARREEHARKVERERQRSLERKQLEEDAEEYSPKGKRGKGKGKKAKSKDKKVNQRGGRGKMLATRYTVIGVSVILMGFGVKSIVFPPDIPPPDVLASQIQQEMNMSAFPADQAESFILGFTKAYLTYDPATTAERGEALSQFTTSANLVDGLTVPAEAPQTVVEGPYISGVRYVDNNNALFTTTAKLDNGRWVSIATPVFYDDTARSFIVAGTPSLAPNPQLAASAGKAPDLQEVDPEATDSASATVTSFMKAWGASDPEALSVVVADGADPRVWNGLEGLVQLDRVDQVEVFVQPDEASSTWQANVNVVWSVTTTPQNDAEEGEVLPEDHPRYSGSYQLLLLQSEDGKWFVADIIPAQYTGTPDPNAPGPGEPVGEEVPVE